MAERNVGLDPTILQSDLGEQIRRLRLERGFTLEELAATSGCSLGSLSQLERGKGNPAFFTLVKVAHALDVPVARLLHVEHSTSPVVRRGEGRQLNPHPMSDESASTYELLTPDLDRALEVIRYEIPPGISTEATPFVHRGEEVGIVLAGVQEVHVNGVTYTLYPGDTISFQSSLPHWFRNPGDETLVGICICTPPTF
jgi:transcriptional regulator with XRE-family HTH domain